ncbi:MAG: prepilin-type N-terminal cleavage/methylation domain-containing protein [Magnetococcales bacterium]|nr:prepilin-type N-terminal cleavage/methylation domain-containing protein [Magnetococcales bacterium]
MRGHRGAAGFSLIEMIFFIVVLGISMAGIIPLYNNVLSNLHVMDEGMQAEYLGLEMVETLKSVYNKGAGFIKIVDANFPSQYGIDIGGRLQFDRVVVIEGMIPGLVPGPCTGQDYIDEDFKCITVKVLRSGSSEVLFREQLINSDLLN